MRRSVVVMACILLTAALLTVALLTAAWTAEAKTLTWAFQGDVLVMDPQAHRETFTEGFLGNIMEPLVRRDRQLKLEPALAERWEVVSPTVWRFHLRRGVKFSNGNPFNADDVVTTFNRAKDDRSVVRGQYSAFKAVRRVDDHTVEFETHKPYPLVLNDLSGLQMLDREWLTEHKALDPVDPAKGQDSHTLRNAVGTGPFKLVSFKPDDRVVLEVNPDWWASAKKEHNLTRVVFRPIKADATRVAALLSGEIDLMFPAPIQDVARINATSGVKVVETPELRTILFGFEMGKDELNVSNVKGKNPLKDLRVRKAIYQAIDVDAIIKRVMRSHAMPASVIMPPAMGGYDSRLNRRLLPHDPAAAKKLLAEAGYPGGFEMGMDCPNDRYNNDEEICVAMVSMLAKVGIKANLTAQTKAKHFPKVQAGASDFWMLGWAGTPTLDADLFMTSIMVCPDGVKGAFNPGRYCNKQVDELQGRSASELDPEKRRQLIYEAFKLHKEEIGHFPLHTQTNLWGMKKSVSVSVPANGIFDLRFTKIGD